MPDADVVGPETNVVAGPNFDADAWALSFRVTLQPAAPTAT
jgi:hypothetical protein